MGLREDAENDLAFIIEDKETGGGWDITITDPTGKTDDFIGLSNDISFMIDPDTGEAISGRVASVSIRISTLISKGFGIPKAVAETSSKPWIVEFLDLNGNPYVFKVSQSNPDRGMGLITCLLEQYEE